MPYHQDEWTFDLASVDCPEFEVTCVDPHTLPTTVRRAAEHAGMVVQRVVKRQDVPDEAFEDATGHIETLARRVLRRWNLPYPEGHPKAGEIVPLDGTETDPLGVIPGYVAGAICQEVGRRLFAVPKRSGERGVPVLPPRG